MRTYDCKFKHWQCENYSARRQRENILKSGKNCAGLQKCGSNGTLEITGSTGKITAYGGQGGAGIGGGNNGEGKETTGVGQNITITGGTVIAQSTKGAGIGGGSSGTGTYITITGGDITATGGGSGAGIGGGNGYCQGSYITITGGTVTANGGGCAAGIGGGFGGTGSNITIEGGTVIASGGGSGAGIGGGDYCGNGTDITISGGVVIASGSGGGAGIGGGNNGEGKETTGVGQNITITGGTVIAQSTKGAGIGGGAGGIGSDIVISGGSVRAVSISGNNIGGGQNQAAVIPNGNSASVYLLTVANPNGNTVYIDGDGYDIVNHTDADSADTNLYVYLTGETHIVTVDGADRVYNFYTDKFYAVPKATDFVFTEPANLIYSGSEKTAAVAAADGVKGMGVISVKYYDLDGNEASPVNVGTYKIKIDVEMGDRFDSANDITADLWTFTVQRVAPSASDLAFVKPENLVYNGTVKNAEITSADGVQGMGAVTAVRYYDKNGVEVEPINAGTYYIKADVADGSNYTALKDISSPDWKFTVEKADVVVDSFIFSPAADLVYSGKAKTATVTATDGVQGMGDITLKYYDENGNETVPVNVGSYTVKIDVNEGHNYNGAKDLTLAEWSFAITKATANVSDTEKSHIWTERGAQQLRITALPADMGALGEAFVVGINDGSEIIGDTASFTDGVLAYVLDSNTAGEIGKSASITVTQPCQNYEDITFNVIIKLTDKKVQKAPEGCDIYFEDNGDGTLKAVITAVDGAEYKFGDSGWSKSNVLDNVPHATMVTAQVRMAETNVYIASDSVS